tara:strand:- start:60370 stop:60723 length:354 start_codon:yes stop_codon:yes gene_type:complete
LSDYELEDSVNHRISFSYFCGLTIDQVAPGHSTAGRFRAVMINTGAYENLFKEINIQLEAHQIIVKKGFIVDVSLIDTPLRPKGNTTHKVTQDRSEQEVSVKKSMLRVKTKMRWLRK